MQVKDESLEKQHNSVQTNMGSMSIPDYLDIKAIQNGFDSYEDMVAKGYSIDGFDEYTQQIKEELNHEMTMDEAIELVGIYAMDTNDSQLKEALQLCVSSMDTYQKCLEIVEKYGQPINVLLNELDAYRTKDDHDKNTDDMLYEER